MLCNGSSCELQHKGLLGLPVQVPGAQFPVQLPANAPGDAVKCGPVLVPLDPHGDPDEAHGFRLEPCPVLASVAVWGLSL